MVDDKKDLVSIVLPTYNGSRHLAQSIESCLNQTYNNIELIIVNDSSTDSTEDIILSFQDSRIIYVKNDVNQGLPKSLNIGFAKSLGEYLTWTSDDNYYALCALEVMLKYLKEDRRIDFLYCNGYAINVDGNITGEFLKEEAWKLIKYNSVGPCFLYKRKVYSAIGDYDPEMFLVEDYDYWLRVYKKFNMKIMYKKLYYTRKHDQSLTSMYSKSEILIAFRKAFRKNVTTRQKIYYRLREKVERLRSKAKIQHFKTIL